MGDWSNSGRLMAAALLLLVTANGVAGYCRQGSEWIEHNGNCYHWTREQTVNWFRAQLNCKQYGGHLVSIPTLSDNDFLLRLTQCSSDFWIGMVNTVHPWKGQTRGYEWWDGTSHNYTNLTPRTNDYYDCVYSTPNGRWNNYYCQHNFTYVCKAPATAQGGLDEKPLSGTGRPAEGKRQDDEVAWASSVDPTRLPPTVPPVKCPVGWQLLDRSCYLIHSSRTNYFNAQMSCQALGASVASVLTRREHTLLTVALGCNSPVWIGLEKARPCFKQPTKDHCWVWMDRNPVNYLEWAPGQTVDKREFECVILDGQWKVMNCYSEYRYICKKAAFSSGNTE